MLTFCFLAFFCNAEPVTESNAILTQTSSSSRVFDGTKTGHIKVED